VRLISGRNNPEFSFGSIAETDEGIGKQVLEIWNGRVESLRDKFSILRTVVLVKSLDLSEFMAFETDTAMYPPDRYKWAKNERGNLEGFDIASGEHRFIWQRHGSQFTIIETVPQKKLCFRVKKPKKLSQESVLKTVGFNKSWIQVV